MTQPGMLGSYRMVGSLLLKLAGLWFLAALLVRALK